MQHWCNMVDSAGLSPTSSGTTESLPRPKIVGLAGVSDLSHSMLGQYHYLQLCVKYKD